MKIQRFAGNFKATYWSEKVQTELEKSLVVSNWCDYSYEGEIKFNERVKLVGVTRPTVGNYVPGTDIIIETLADNAQYIDINHMDYFAFYVDDVDKAQSNPKYLSAEMSEASKALAEQEDANTAKEAFDGSLTTMRSSSTDISAASDPLKLIDDGTQKLYENNVPASTPLAADLTPEHIILIKRKMAELFTSNVDYIKNSAVGKYNNTYLRMTNNLYNDGTDSMELLRTKKAVAVVGIIDQVNKVDKEKGFGQIVKGLNVYGIKVVRPKELYVIKVH